MREIPLHFPNVNGNRLWFNGKVSCVRWWPVRAGINLILGSRHFINYSGNETRHISLGLIKLHIMTIRKFGIFRLDTNNRVSLATMNWIWAAPREIEYTKVSTGIFVHGYICVSVSECASVCVCFFFFAIVRDNGRHSWEIAKLLSEKNW